MTILAPLRTAAFVVVATTCLGGCLCDSINPWLQSDSILKRDVELAGEWEIVNEDWRDKYTVKLKKKRDPRSIELQNYYIEIGSKRTDTWFHFSGVVHEVNGIRLLQVTNFTHDHDDVFSLANRPTVSLWQISYDDDNIVVWAPGFLGEGISAVKTLRDADDKLLFVDSTENLQAYIEDWTENYPGMKDEIDMILPIALTRSGTEFRMPEEMRELVPRVYEGHVKERSD